MSRGYSCLRKVCLSLCVGMILHMETRSQCLNNLGTRLYDTVLNGIGYGTYTIRLPRWNPDSGTLVSVRVGVGVNIQYGFTLKNVDAIPSIYTLTVGREDYITSPAMAVPYDNTVEQKIGVYPLLPNAAFSQAPFALLNNYANTDSITTNVASFLGRDSITFTYSPVTYTNLRTNNNSSYNYQATAQDGMNFSLTYLYCRSGTVLASGLTNWSAVPENAGAVLLSWAVVNEVSGRVYEIERSPDGQHFSTVGTVGVVVGATGNGIGPGGGAGTASGASGSGTATGNGVAEHVYTDHLPGGGGNGAGNGVSGAGAKWYYRLRIVDPATVAYSDVRMVTAGGAGTAVNQGMRVYPSPATGYINLVIGQALTGATGAAGAWQTGAGWQVDILSGSGVLIQRGYYPPTHTVRVDFQRKLSSGTYFVRVADLRGQAHFASSFIIAGAN